MEYAFGNMGLQDKNKTSRYPLFRRFIRLYLENIDENFGFSRYAERLGRSANSFDELYEKLQSDKTFVDNFTLEILNKNLSKRSRNWFVFPFRFPGNLYSGI